MDAIFTSECQQALRYRTMRFILISNEDNCLFRYKNLAEDIIVKGLIAVDISKLDKNMCISIRGTGVGLDKDRIGHVLENSLVMVETKVLVWDYLVLKTKWCAGAVRLIFSQLTVGSEVRILLLAN